MTDRAEFSARENFDELVSMAMEEGALSEMRPVIEKELLHYDILFALRKEGVLDEITFQGGTALRLCYGSGRYSEDLDFAGGVDFSTEKLMAIREVVEKYVTDRYGLAVSVKEPKDMKHDPLQFGVRVSKWQISVETAPDRRDIPRQRIKLEVASVPAHTRTSKILHKNYDILPDGYDSLVVPVESINEILADKLIALPTCTRYIRHRDIWDLAWLRQQRAELDEELIERKLEDYGITDYQHLTRDFLDKLPDIVNSQEFHNQIARFIPPAVLERTLQQEGFTDHIKSTVTEQLEASAKLGITSTPLFSM